MKVRVLLFFIVLFFVPVIYAQEKRNHELGIGLSGHTPMRTYKIHQPVGVGADINAMFGLGKSNQLGGGFGFVYAGYQGNTRTYKMSNTLVPIYLKYRHFIGEKLFLEPQVGYTLSQDKITERLNDGGPFDGIGIATGMTGGFGWGFGVGWRIVKGLDVSIRYDWAQEYYNNNLNSVNSDGFIDFIGVRVGYNFNLQPKKKAAYN